MSDPLFDDRADRYDALVDWDKRLANEAPLYRQLFADIDAHRIIDVACGGGRHAAMFHEWGLTVEGADVSETMIERCRARFGEPNGLHWAVRSFVQPTDAAEPFDAAICVGNSLALAGESTSAETVLEAMMTSLRPGGLCFVQVLNLYRFGEGETVWQKCKRVNLDGEDHVLLKGIHRLGDRAFIDVVDLTLRDNDVEPDFSSTIFSGIDADTLTAAAESAGGTDITLFGDYQRTPYQANISVDLIMVCQRA